jgi:hypothetical protein
MRGRRNWRGEMQRGERTKTRSSMKDRRSQVRRENSLRRNWSRPNNKLNWP